MLNRNDIFCIFTSFEFNIKRLEFITKKSDNCIKDKFCYSLIKYDV